MQTSPKLYCFCVMPFDSSFDDIYELGIKEACEQAGAYCERVDEQIHHDSVVQRIYNQIAKADVVIADLSGQSANVFYETGYAHALDKPTILITSNEDEIPYNLKHYPHIIYGSSISKLRESLRARVRHYVENPQSSWQKSEINVDLFIEGRSLTREEVVYRCPADQYPRPRISLANLSHSLLAQGDFRLGVFGSGVRSATATKKLTQADLITGERMHMFGDFEALYPQQVTSFDVTLKQLPTPEPYRVTFRLFTATGTRDYRMMIGVDDSCSEVDQDSPR